MTRYERIFAKVSDMNPTHLETLAVSTLSTLDSLPLSAFEDIADLAKRVGPEWLEAHHNAVVSA